MIENGQIKKLTPNLLVANVERSLAFYVDLLGFARGMTVPDASPFVFAPGHDPQGAGYQTLQGIMGIGSGGIFGTGIGQGVLKNNYLPEAHTDMIFATIGEELGLLGATMIIAAYVAFAYAGLRVALRCRDPFGKRLAAGLTTLVVGQAMINLAAVLVLAPLTGITLPFVSYGGSSLVVSLASVGVLLNIAGHGGAARAQVPDRSRGDGRPRAAVARGR